MLYTRRQWLDPIMLAYKTYQPDWPARINSYRL